MLLPKDGAARGRFSNQPGGKQDSPRARTSLQQVTHKGKWQDDTGHTPVRTCNTRSPP